MRHIQCSEVHHSALQSALLEWLLKLLGAEALIQLARTQQITIIY